MWEETKCQMRMLRYLMTRTWEVKRVMRMADSWEKDQDSKKKRDRLLKGYEEYRKKYSDDASLGDVLDGFKNHK